MDIMFVNKIPFLATTSRGLHFGTVENLTNRKVPTVCKALQKAQEQCSRRGFDVTAVHADPEFEPLQAAFGQLQFNFCAQNEHVPEIERFIRTVKDRARSGYNNLPFSRIPRLIIIRLVSNAVFWLNAFPHKDGASSTLSPWHLLTGKHLDFNKHVRAEFGAYAQTHEQHSNDMNSRTLGAICLGPSGNEQGGHWFLSLSTGKRIHRHQWTSLPMPDDVMSRVTELARRQGMPRNCRMMPTPSTTTMIPPTILPTMTMNPTMMMMMPMIMVLTVTPTTIPEPVMPATMTLMTMMMILMIHPLGSFLLTMLPPSPAGPQE
jgi:hypothetical protein